MAQGKKTQIAFINGREIAAENGETILSAAGRLGIEIPALCHDERIPAEGGCRLCLVHCEGENGPLAACHTPLGPGMSVQTHHVEVEKLRRSLLTLHLEAAPQTGFRREAVRRGAFFDLLDEYRIETDRWAGEKKAGAIVRDRTHPVIRHTPEACVHCLQCIRACDEIQGQSVFGLENRGSESRVIISGDRSLRESPCVGCGACVDLCPTDALTDRDRSGRRAWPEETKITDSVCGYCSVGCRIRVVSSEGSVRRIDGVRDSTVNGGLHCQKGRFGHNFQGSWDRLSKPMIRQGAGFREVSWDEAIAFTANRLRETVAEFGPDSFGALASNRATNESNYLFQKFCRAVIGTHQIDSSARLCHASTAAALQLATGTGAATASFGDIDTAECIVIAGANPTVSHPVAGARIRQAIRNGARLIVIDPRRIELANEADIFLQISPGCDVAIFHAIARALIEGGVTIPDPDGGRKAFKKFLDEFPIGAVARFSGVDEADILRVARVFGEAGGQILFVHGLGLTQQFHGTSAVLAYLNLAVLTGSLGHSGAGFLPLGGQNNLQGGLDMGCAPDLLPGGFASANEKARARIEKLWGVPLPARAGKTSCEMLEAAAAGELRALWIMGHDVLHSYPAESKTQSALDSLDLLIVQDLFYSDLCRHADIILPAASYLEQEGTFTSVERRFQRVQSAVPPPEQARPDWVIINRVARELGSPWPYQDAADVLSEIAKAAPERFGGISHRRLAGVPDGLQWPCPDADHPGTATLPVPDELKLHPVDVPLSPEHRLKDWPYLLITGRRLDQYNAGSMTRRNAGRQLSDRDRIALNPGDALRDGIAEGSRVSILSRHGRTEVAAELSETIQPGTAFLTFHFPQTHANRLIGPVADPESGCPQFKATAVRIAPIE